MLDPFHERDIEVLRERVLEAVETAHSEGRAALPVSAGQEFHFSSSAAVEFDLGVEASTLAELAERLREVPASCLYQHVFEARLRNDDGADDLSRWLADAGHPRHAARLRDLDIYMLSLEGCRRVVLELLEGGS